MLGSVEGRAKMKVDGLSVLAPQNRGPKSRAIDPPFSANQKKPDSLLGEPGSHYVEVIPGFGKNPESIKDRPARSRFFRRLYRSVLVEDATVLGMRLQEFNHLPLEFRRNVESFHVVKRR